MGCRKPGHMFCDCGWHKKCPKCGGKPVNESLESGAAGRDLGFNKSAPKVKSGVCSCSSFTWAMKQDFLLSSMLSETSPHYDVNEKVIEDEYGSLFTLKEFMEMLDECPIQYNESVGQEFS